MAGVSYFNVYVTHVVETVECQEKPNYCNVIFWGQKDRGLSTKMEEQIATCNFDASPRPLLTDLKKEKHFCALVNSSWVRATISDFSVDRNGSLEVFCIDYGFTVMVPLACIKLIPSTLPFISSCHPLATKFLLADVVIEKGLRGKEPVIHYLQRNISNKNVKAVSLGIRDDFEGVRIYSYDVLVAKLLVESFLGTPAATYVDAVKQPVPNHRQLSVSSISPPHMTKNSYNRPPSAMSVSHKMLNFAPSQSRAIPGASYTASCLEMNVIHTVMVTYVQNGPQKFVIQRKSSDAVNNLTNLSKKLSEFAALNSKTLVNVDRGTPCIAISSRDKLFHRGVITLVEDVRYAQVYFVDYGYSELVDLQSLFEIPADFISIELCAYRVTLEDAASLMTLDKVSENFTRLVLYQTFKCHVTVETMPQSVILMDDAGRTVKELVLASVADSRQPLNISELLKTAPLSPITAAGNIKVATVEVGAVEDLFVTCVGSPGKFFGQFERRPVAELEALKSELQSTYSNCIPGQPSQIPLLYADVKSHIGDYGVIKWSADGHCYRVQIVEEFAHDVAITFVDYGNNIRVCRQEIWVPSSSLKWFSRPSFGINCLVPGITLTENEWALLVNDKSVRVKLGLPINKVYPATFVNMSVNNLNRPLSACSNLSPIAPEFDPVGGAKPVVPQVTNRKLEFDAPGQSALRNALPNIVVENGQMTNHSLLEDSWSIPIPKNKVLEDSWSIPVKSAKALTVEPSRQERERVSSVSSSRSSTGRNPEEKMDWESAEPKDLPREPTPISRPLEISKRVMPISQPTKLVYPHQTGLEGATKNLEMVFVEDPNSFYCHLIEAVPLLEKLMDNLATAYLAAPKEPFGCIQVGVACVAQYTDDKCWYRGQILNVGATEVEVLFVDYGNKQRTPTTLLKAIEAEFVKLPPQAYHCSLAGVQDCSRSWTPQDKARLEEVGMGKPLKATVSDHRENDKYFVRLVDESSRPQVVINDLFAPPREIVPVPDVFSYSSLPTSDLTNVNVVWFSNIGRFFLSPVDVASHQHDLDQLEEHYSALSSDELVEDSPCVGLPCVVKFKDDGRYYRSEILSMRGSYANVLFIDYGNEQDTPLKELKRIHPRFLKFPQLTWQCRLNNVTMPDSEIFYSQDLKDHIKACFPEGPTLGARFHEPTDGVYPVDLAAPDIGDVANYLVKNKVLCRHSTCMGQEKEVKFPPQSLDFVPDQIISTTAYLPFIKTPLEFWIQLESESVEAIMEQSDQLVTQPDFLNNKNSFVPVVGKSCLAFFNEDGRWYRATVESLEPNSVIVYYVDYGNTCSVGLEHLRDLPLLLAEKPPMAFKCCLAGAESPISKEVTGAFLALAFDLVATVKVVEVVNEILHVRLCNTADGVDLGEKIQLLTKPVELEVYVGYSISPDRFWIQRKEEENRIAEIQEQLGRELQGPNMGSFQVQGHPVAGQMYAVYHPVYETLYRAIVKSFDSYSGLAAIQFVDYGDDHKVSEKDFLQLPENLKKIPPMAFESSLNLQSRPKHWPEEALKYFNSICSPEVVFQAKLGVKADGIQQIDSMHAREENVIEVLNSKIKQSQLEQTGRVLDILEVSKSLKQVETQMHPVIRPSTELINDMNGIPGQVISSKAIAVCLNSPTAVWLHLDPAAADDIMNTIEQYAQQPEFAQIHSLEPVVGVSCLALFPDDQLWYRAVVESVDQDSVTVNYVDFGNSSPVGRDQLRPIPPSLVVKPALAFKCALDGADRVADNLPSTRNCQAVLFDQLLSVTFVEKTQKHIFVRLRDSDGHDLNEKLGLPAAPTNVRLENQRTNASSTLVSSRPIPGAEDVRVSHIKSAGMFWIQRESNCEEIEQIRDTLRPLDSNDSPNVPPLSVKENVLYAVMHPEYNRFYRARANQINGDCAEVYFLDIGYTDWVPLSSIRPCPAILKYIPAMANECTFRSPIYPDQYSEEIRKAFSDATEGVVCQAVFSGPPPSQGIQCIESLFAKGVNVGNLLYNLISSIAPQSGTSGGFGNLPLFPSKQQRGL